MSTLLIMLSTFALVGVSFFAGYRLGKQPQLSPQGQQNTPQGELSKEEQAELEKLRKRAKKVTAAYQSLMSYDLDTALGRRE